MGDRATPQLCPNCRTELRPGARFCRGCGQSTEARDNTAAAFPAPPFPDAPPPAAPFPDAPFPDAPFPDAPFPGTPRADDTITSAAIPAIPAVPRWPQRPPGGRPSGPGEPGSSPPAGDQNPWHQPAGQTAADYPGPAAQSPEYQWPAAPSPEYPGPAAPSSEYPGPAAPSSEYPGPAAPSPDYPGPGSPSPDYPEPDYPDADYPAARYGAPDGPPGRPAGRNAGSRRGRVIFGLLAVIVVAAGIAAGLLIARARAPHQAGAGPAASSPAAPATSAPASGAPSSPSPGAGPASARQQGADNLSRLLAQSVAERGVINNAYNDVANCGPALPSDQGTFQQGVASRQALLSQLGGMADASALPASMISSLTQAWTASIQADQDFAVWAGDERAGCTPDGSDPSLSAATVPDEQATRAKMAFVASWNPIAQQYGLPTYSQDQL